MTVKCPICDKTFKNALALAGHKKAHGVDNRTWTEKNKIAALKRGQKKRKQGEAEYAKSPNLCAGCEEPLPYNKRMNKFCSSSCAAKTNNKGRVRSDESRRKTAGKIKDWHATMSEEKKNEIATKAVKTRWGRELKTWGPFSYVFHGTCSICEKQFYKKGATPTKTCSRKCYSKQQSNAAIEQRVKTKSRQGYYKGIWCDSTYEMVWAAYNLEHGVEFARCQRRVPYTFEGEEHMYCPDFEKESGEVVEVKGYETDLTDTKHQAARDAGINLTVIKKEDMTEMFEWFMDLFQVPMNRLHEVFDDYKPKYEHICAYSECGKVFKNDKKNSTYCSPQCSGKAGAERLKQRRVKGESLGFVKPKRDFSVPTEDEAIIQKMIESGESRAEIRKKVGITDSNLSYRITIILKREGLPNSETLFLRKEFEKGRRLPKVTGLTNLTEKTRMLMLSKPVTSHEIAEEIETSPEKAEYHGRRVLEAYGLKSRAGLYHMNKWENDLPNKE